MHIENKINVCSINAKTISSKSNKPEINSNIIEEGQGTVPEAVTAVTAVT